MLIKFQVNPTQIVSTAAYFNVDQFWMLSRIVQPGGAHFIDDAP